MTTALAERSKTLKDLMAAMRPQLEAVLPRHLTPDRLIKVALVACQRTPKLLECDQQTILQSVMQAAELGLDVGGGLGSAYLVPYGKTCQLIIGYRGLIDLARRSGQIKSIEARPVFEGEQFKMTFGLNPILEHVPNLLDAPKADKMLGVYVIARLQDGGHHCEWMSKPEIDAIRSRSKASASGPWVTDYVEMAKKTVVRRAAKYLPLSVEMGKAFEIEDGVPDSPAPDILPALPAATGTAGVAAKLSAGQPQAAAQAEEAGPPVEEQRFIALIELVQAALSLDFEDARAIAHRWLIALQKKDVEDLKNTNAWKAVWKRAQEQNWQAYAPEPTTA